MCLQVAESRELAASTRGRFPHLLATALFVYFPTSYLMKIRGLFSSTNKLEMFRVSWVTSKFD